MIGPEFDVWGLVWQKICDQCHGEQVLGYFYFIAIDLRRLQYDLSVGKVKWRVGLGGGGLVCGGSWLLLMIRIGRANQWHKTFRILSLRHTKYIHNSRKDHVLQVSCQECSNSSIFHPPLSGHTYDKLETFRVSLLGSNIFIHDIKDDTYLQVSGQEPSISFK